jgi:hypothetical protein
MPERLLDLDRNAAQVDLGRSLVRSLGRAERFQRFVICELKVRSFELKAYLYLADFDLLGGAGMQPMFG